MDIHVRKLDPLRRRAIARELAISLVTGVRHQGMRLMLIDKFANQFLSHSDEFLLELHAEQQRLAEFEKRLYDQ